MSYDLGIFDFIGGIAITTSLAGVALGYFTRDAVLTYVHKSDYPVRTLDNSNQKYAPPVYDIPKPVQEPVKPSLDVIVHSDLVKKKCDELTHATLVDNSADQGYDGSGHTAPVDKKYDGSTNTAPASYKRD